MQQSFHQRKAKIRRPTHPERYLSPSFWGEVLFAYLIGLEVDDFDDVPEGMVHFQSRRIAQVRAAGWLLTKFLGDDVVTDEHGGPQIGRGVAPDRVISLTDPEMRHGPKSEAKHFDGRKVQVATDAANELVLAVEPSPANRTDGADLLKLVDAIQTRTGRGHRVGAGRYPLRHGRQSGRMQRAWH